VYTVSWLGTTPNIRSNTVYIYGSGLPCLCFLQVWDLRSGSIQASLARAHSTRIRGLASVVPGQDVCLVFRLQLRVCMCVLCVCYVCSRVCVMCVCVCVMCVGVYVYVCVNLYSMNTSQTAHTFATCPLKYIGVHVFVVFVLHCVFVVYVCACVCGFCA
jgi:hypothetical protein